MATWPGGVAAITMFTEDLPATKRFYEAAPELVDPAPVAPPSAGSRFQLTPQVDDVDATCEDLRARGVELLTGPVTRRWGPRTASFRDPGGHLWEIAS